MPSVGRGRECLEPQFCFTPISNVSSYINTPCTRSREGEIWGRKSLQGFPCENSPITSHFTILSSSGKSCEAHPQTGQIPRALQEPTAVLKGGPLLPFKLWSLMLPCPGKWLHWNIVNRDSLGQHCPLLHSPTYRIFPNYISQSAG